MNQILLRYCLINYRILEIRAVDILAAAKHSIKSFWKLLFLLLSSSPTHSCSNQKHSIVPFIQVRPTNSVLSLELGPRNFNLSISALFNRRDVNSGVFVVIFLIWTEKWSELDSSNTKERSRCRGKGEGIPGLPTAFQTVTEAQLQSKSMRHKFVL